MLGLPQPCLLTALRRQQEAPRSQPGRDTCSLFAPGPLRGNRVGDTQGQQVWEPQMGADFTKPWITARLACVARQARPRHTRTAKAAGV